MSDTAAIGHNSITEHARNQLRAIVERIERVEDDMKALGDDRKDIYLEARGQGYDVKALRTIIRMRKQDANEREEHEAIVDTYMHALGMA